MSAGAQIKGGVTKPTSAGQVHPVAITFPADTPPPSVERREEPRPRSADGDDDDAPPNGFNLFEGTQVSRGRASINTSTVLGPGKQILGGGGGGIGTTGSSITFLLTSFGLDESLSGGWEPPDCSFAVSPTSGVQPANDAVRIFSRRNTGLVAVATMSGEAFTQWYPTPPFDPRVLYDYKTGHFIVVYDTFPYDDSSNNYHQQLVVAVSQTSDASGAWWITQMDSAPIISANPNTDQPLLDFPDAGIDAHNLYITSNDFTNSGTFASILAFDKDALEKGKTANYVFFSNLNFGVTPPFVRSLGPSRQSYFIYSESGSSAIGAYAASGNVSNNTLTLSSSFDITAPYYDPPPLAIQPEFTDFVIETLDRFEDKTTQLGDHIYATNTFDDNGLPTVRAYDIDCYSGKVAQHVDLYAQENSNDFNPSITVNDNGIAVVTWNYTYLSRIVANERYESIRTAVLPGNRLWGTNPVSGVDVPRGQSYYPNLEYRNGDYSMTVVDPKAANTFWGINQLFGSDYGWVNFIFELRAQQGPGTVKGGGGTVGTN